MRYTEATPIPRSAALASRVWPATAIRSTSVDLARAVVAQPLYLPLLRPWRFPRVVARASGRDGAQHGQHPAFRSGCGCPRIALLRAPGRCCTTIVDRL